MGRFVVPAILLVAMAVGILISKEPQIKIVTEFPDIVRRTENPHSRLPHTLITAELGVMSFNYLDDDLRALCVCDDSEAFICRRSCSELTSFYTTNPRLLNKSVSESLPSFLAHDSTIEALRTKGFRGCMIFYASSWNTSEPNNLRSITVGVFDFIVKTAEPPSVAFEHAFNEMSFLFGAREFNSTSFRSRHVQPFSQYYYLELKLFMFLIILSMFPASYVNDPIEDIDSRVRAFLASMGMSNLAYWRDTFLLHWIQYAVCIIISVSILCLWGKFTSAYLFLVCTLMLFLGTASNQLTMYTVAAITRRRNMAVTLLCNFICLILSLVLTATASSKKAYALPLICLLPPVAPTALLYFGLSYATYCLEYYSVDYVSDIPDLIETCWNNEYILLSLVVMPIHIVIMCCIIAVYENINTTCAACCCKRNPDGVEKSTHLMDNRAQKEADRVTKSTRGPHNVLEVRQLCKTYPNGVRAVRGVTFAPMAGEIFGLLGANGAGKSTSMSVIVGEESATSGECEVRAKDGAWLSAKCGASAGVIGYCPQHNPLFDCVTVAEHVRLYAHVRGVPSADVENQVSALIRGLGLEKHLNKCANQLSGGNKRRLCLAIALLGDPALVVIDEASTGVDPENKRFIWTAIRSMLTKQRSVMVTTHSMEEVEALCSRVGIMNRGRMIAFGTVQQLRSSYGDAYTLDVLLKREMDDDGAVQQKRATIKGAVASQFKGATVLDELSRCVQFYIPKASVSRVSSALEWLAASQTRLGLDYFTFYQMSLDQVFVKLVKQFDAASEGD